jgi:hypothetical protein
LCRHSGIGLKRWLIQIHKDYAKGIEAARRHVFPSVRSVEDYFHMLQRVMNTLPTKLTKQKTVPEPPLSSASAAADQSQGTSKKRRANTNPKKRSKVVEKLHFGSCIDWINMTRFVPTLQLFDAVWRVFFHMVQHQWKEPHAVEYLQSTYFAEPTLDNVRMQYKRVGVTSWGRSTFLVAGHWYGILGTAPGTGTGSQTIEARHSQWQEEVRVRSRSNIFTIWPAMQDIYDSWEDTFAWGAEVSFSNTARHFNETLLNGAGLKSVGRSTAVEFWRDRANGNYIPINRQTGPIELGVKAHTTFYVMQTHRVGDIMPAKAVISKPDADCVVSMITSEGPALEKILVKAGIVLGEPWTDTWSVDFNVARHFFKDLCVVITGHLPGQYWPKYRKLTRERRDTTLCTCAEYVQHAECEHQVFVLGLLASPGEAPDLESTPTIRKKGRKRKNMAD